MKTYIAEISIEVNVEDDEEEDLEGGVEIARLGASIAMMVAKAGTLVAGWQINSWTDTATLPRK